LDENSLSFIHWEFDAPGLAPGMAANVVGAGGFLQSTKVLDDQTITIARGISSSGNDPFPGVE
jgi:hypothetical protein